MELVYPTENEIIDFFVNHTGYISVLRISELLIASYHSNIQEGEWKHVYKLLHKLKAEGFLLIQNEGEDIYNEKFSSTPDRIEKFLEKTTKINNFYNNKNQNKTGVVEFIYSSNNGTYLIGEGEFLFGIKFSGASQQSIYIYNDHSTIDSIALIKNVTEFYQVSFKIKYDGTSRVRCPSIGEIVLIRNKNNKYALIKIKNIQMESRGDKNDKVTFSFKILEREYTDLIAGEEQGKDDVGAKPIIAKAVKTIKNKLKTEGLFIESRSQDEDLHLLIGKRDGTADKAHIVIDGKTAEIRVEDNQQEPTDLIEKVESVLTLKGGKKVKVTREAIEELPSFPARNNSVVSGVELSTYEIQKQKFEKNKKNYLDPRNSSK